MATISVIDKSTYQDIVDDILFDAPELPDNLKAIPNEEYIRWIVQAEQDICQRITVRDRKYLRLIANQEDYLFQDSSNISGTGTITTVGTAVTGVGTLFLTEVVPFATITVGTATHTVFDVTDDTHLILVDAFTPDISVATAFTIAPSAVEIPTETFQITTIDRLENSYRREIKVRGLSWLLALRVEDRIGKVYINLDLPYVAAEHSVGEKRYLKFYPPSDADKTITLYTIIKINPRVHVGDKLTDKISLTNEFEPMIRAYVLRTLSRKAKNEKDEVKYNAYYADWIHTMRLNTPNVERISFEYR